ncbi:MAG: outer membrane protein transport protein [Thermodesulfobacteriota bacterium]|nr:outer membrane protein transport protein [Thermodesulfobacteriota bacterium]
MKRTVQKSMIAVLTFCLSQLFFFSPGWAQNDPLIRMEIPSSPNPVGSGARALGMGGAFIAIADDATAASWNPGGLIQLDVDKPEISFVGDYIYRTEDNSFGSHPEASRSESIDDYNLNYLSAAYPFEAGARNMIVSLNYQHLYDFNRDWNFNFNYSNPVYTAPVQVDYEQEGNLYALGLAYCVEVHPDFSAGITLNYWGDFLYENKWEQNYLLKRSMIIPPPPAVGTLRNSTENKKEEFSFEGWNANLGFLWKIGKNWRLGGVFKTPFTADIDHKITTETVQTFPTNPALNTHTVTTQSYDEELRMPMSYGIGLAYRFSDTFRVSADIYRTHWDDFEFRDAQGNKTSPVSGKDIADSDIDPTTWFRFGAEYRMEMTSSVISLRGGAFYDPAPAEGSPDDYYGFSFGSGLAYGRYVFDIAYQFRFGDDVGGSSLQGLDFSQDVREHKVYMSLIVHL